MQQELELLTKILAGGRAKLGMFEVVLRTLEKVYPGGPGGI